MCVCVCVCVCVLVSRLQQERVALLQELHQVRSALRDKETRDAETDIDVDVVREAAGAGGSRPKTSKARAGRMSHPDPTSATNSASTYRREKSLVVDLNKEVRAPPFHCLCMYVCMYVCNMMFVCVCLSRSGGQVVAVRSKLQQASQQIARAEADKE